MKKLLFLILFLLPSSIFAGEITLDSLKSQFSAAFIQEYHLTNLDQDILAQTGSSGIYENSIQYLSKDSTWDKSKFDAFVMALKNKKTAEAARLYKQNWETMSPFLPTCCAGYEYLGFRGMKNGILTLTAGGNGDVGYHFEYIFYANDRIFSIRSQAYFHEEVNLHTKKAKLMYTSNPKKFNGIILKTTTFLNDGNSPFSGIMQYWFASPNTSNSKFKHEYNKFVNYMTTIWN